MVTVSVLSASGVMVLVVVGVNSDRRHGLAETVLCGVWPRRIDDVLDMLTE